MTFRDAWLMVALHAPVPDPMLSRAWTQWAYEQFCDRKKWSNQKVETAINVFDQKQGNCVVAIGSPVVHGISGVGGLQFAATDIGRQFRLGTIPIYTIVSVNVTGATTATLERNYSEPSGTVVGYVLDAYVTMPEDFHTFYSVLDPVNRWRLRWWIPGSQIDQWDPARQSTGNARLLANQAYSPVTGMTTRARFELYPFQTSQRSYPVWYYRKPVQLADSDVLFGPLLNAGASVLLDGALSRCAMWPGTDGKKNPYFNLGLAEVHRQAFENKLIELAVVDDDLYFEGLPVTQFEYCDFPWDAAWWQSHEPSIIG